MNRSEGAKKLGPPQKNSLDPLLPLGSGPNVVFTQPFCYETFQKIRSSTWSPNTIGIVHSLTVHGPACGATCALVWLVSNSVVSTLNGMLLLTLVSTTAGGHTCTGHILNLTLNIFGWHYTIKSWYCSDISKSNDLSYAETNNLILLTFWIVNSLNPTKPYLLKPWCNDYMIVFSDFNALYKSCSKY